MSPTVLVAIYLAIGVLVLVVEGARTLASYERPSAFIRDMNKALYPERSTLRYRVLAYGVAPLLAGVALIIGWPVALGMVAWNAIRREDDESPPGPEKFSVRRDDLLETVTLADVEQDERPGDSRGDRRGDPSGAAPDLPFGHLHGAWTAFRAGLQPGDQLWRFSARWPREARWAVTYRGYAAVRGDAVVSFVRTEREGPDAG